MEDIKIKIDLTKVLPMEVTRTLKDGQALCPKCEGVGLIRKSDSQGEYITVCTECYGRTYLTKCPHCGEVERSNSFHECDGSRNKRALDNERKEQDKWSKAEKVSYEDACKRFEQVVVGWDTYIPVEEVIDNIVDGWNEGEERTIPRVWGTYSKSIAVDADDILPNALEDLHEDAEVGKRDREDLDKFLAEWCQRPSVINSTKTYYPDEKIAIVVTEDDVKTYYPSYDD